MNARVEQKLRELEDNQKIMEEYLLLKYKEKDWHGVSDAANDIRDIVAAVEVLMEVNKNENN